MLIVTDAGFAQVCFQVAKEMEVTAAEQIDQKIIAKTAFQFARVFLSGNGITATVKDQRWRVAAIDRQHLADEDDVIAAVVLERSEERSAGKDSVSTCRSRWSRYH